MRKFTNIRIFVLSLFFFQLTYASAPTGRYTDENGLPISPTTQQIQDTATGLIWQRGHSDINQTWSAAQSYCAELVIENQGAGSWRLPSVKELRTLVDVTASNPSIDIHAFPNTPVNWFWSSTQIAGGVDAWFVYFFDGQVALYYTSSSLSARCVR